MRRVSVFSLVAVLSLGGCGDDAGGDVDAGPPPVDQCLGSVDMDVIVSRRAPDGGWPDGSVPPDTVIFYFEDCIRGDCLDYVFEDDLPGLASCTYPCLDMTDVSDLSSGCRDCYLEEVSCAARNCAVECLQMVGDACAECATTNCVPRFDECVGFGQ